jgi:hypothetical protein
MTPPTSEESCRYGKQPLERIFKGNKARVLDHLATSRPFDYSPQELSKICHINIIELERILEHLEDNDLIEFTDKKKYKLSENKTTLALCKFQFEIASNDIDKVIAKQEKSNLEQISPFSARLLKFERCVCGHLLTSHKCNIPKTISSKNIHGECTKCDCEDMCIR